VRIGAGKLCRVLLAVAALSALGGPAQGDGLFDEAAQAFAGRLRLGGWERLAVQHGGRVKTFDSFARGQLGFFHGDVDVEGVSPTFAFLELYFNAGEYLERPVIHVRGERLRRRLAAAMPPPLAQSLSRTGRLAPIDLLGVEAVELLVATGRARPRHVDLDRIGSLAGALAGLRHDLSVRSALQGLLARVDAFLALESVRVIPPGESGGPYRAPVLRPDVLASPPAGTEADGPARRLSALARAWRDRDAGRANALLDQLCRQLPRRGGAAYPPAWRRELEIVYTRLSGFSVAWAGYALAAVLLLAAGRMHRRLRAAGLVVYGLTTAFLAAGVGLRWLLSGRGWRLPPLTNQYETVVAAALMAALAGGVLEAVFRKGGFALAAALFAAASLLAGFFYSARLGAEINPPQGILVSGILAWHVATLVMGYAMIGMSLAVSLAYVALAGRGRRSGRALAELDRSNVLLVRLACWLLAIGVVLGAYWADRAWGRWWGWDPKETWGLMTFLVYLAIVHLRLVLPRPRRGLWTAVLSIAGCAVMAFTWWGVNYLLAGLHSYA